MRNSRLGIVFFSRKVDPLLDDSDMETEICESEDSERCLCLPCRDFLLWCSFLFRDVTFLVDFARSLVAFSVFFGFVDLSFRTGV